MSIGYDVHSSRVLQDYHALLVGTVEACELMLDTLITMGIFEGVTCYADVVFIGEQDKHPKSYQSFQTCPFLSLRIQYMTLEDNDDVLEQYLKKHLFKMNQVFVCFEHQQDEDRITGLIRMVFNQQKVMSMIHEHQEGLLSECESTLIEQLGQEIFRDYKTSNHISQCFEELTLDEKLTNYNSALHITTKLYLAGLRIKKECHRAEQEIATKEEFLKFLGQEKIERLARLEHLRWCSFNLLAGYEPLPLSKAQQGSSKCNSGHTCLVPWEELPQVSRHCNRDMQKEDRDRVTNIYEYVTNSNHKIVMA